MKKIRNIVFYEPNESHFSGFLWRAEKMIDLGYLKTLPIITKEKGKIDPFWIIILEVPDDEALFWIGVCEGADICRNNRPLMVGTD